MASGHRAIDGKPERTTTEAASNNWINAVTEASAGLENFVLPLWNIGVTPQTPWRISSVHLWNMRGAPQALHRQGPAAASFSTRGWEPSGQKTLAGWDPAKSRTSFFTAARSAVAPAAAAAHVWRDAPRNARLQEAQASCQQCEMSAPAASHQKGRA